MKIPIVALRGMVIMPGTMTHFDITRQKSMLAIEHAMTGTQKICLLTQNIAETEDPGEDNLHRIGVVCSVMQVMRLPNHAIRVLIDAGTRAELLRMTQLVPYLEGEVLEIPFSNEINDMLREEAMLRVLREAVDNYALQNKAYEELRRFAASSSTLEELMNNLMVRMDLPWQDKQKLLETDSVFGRYNYLCSLLERERDVARLKKEIQQKVRESIDKTQKEYLIREQIKALREELGEGDKSEMDQLEIDLKDLTAPDEVKKALEKEFRRLRNIPAGSPEVTVSRTWIETVMDIPWQAVTEDNKDIVAAGRILDEDHYGLEKVKERILEYLAVRTFAGKGEGSILCFVGPPGTGKTSIARSIARALDKKYVRVCLGGVRDEAEIRGHRRTYIGAMPGRIVSALRQAKTANPLMLLDEIDKVSSDYKGDTSSALLEVLDSEQNAAFKDHYVELPVDLSKVMFIATANTLDTIPEPLLDRMEIIEISSYTENEKFHIGRDYLIKKQLEKNGLSPVQMAVTDEALKKIIHNYTREAGVRNLERSIGDLCRKAAREILEKGIDGINVTTENITDYLGKEKVSFEDVNKENQVGIVTGLAWTRYGGETLEIEVNIMPGEGGLRLTGQMGDVMKESAEAALTYVRSVSDDYDVPEDFYKTHEIHVHIPEGAVPKDGPSAGITMATAMLSAVSGKETRADLAMTGEITLRGRILPIGGLKEKLLAARMAEIHTVLIPLKNEPDINELSTEITDGIEIVMVSDMNEVVKRSFIS